MTNPYIHEWPQLSKFRDVIIVALIELEIVNNLVKGLKNRTSAALHGLKNAGILDLYYSEVKITNRFSLIRSDNVLRKCITYDIGNDNLLVSYFDIDSDYN